MPALSVVEGAPAPPTGGGVTAAMEAGPATNARNHPGGGLSTKRPGFADDSGDPGGANSGRLAALGLLDELRRDDQRAAARDDEAVARELVERAGDRLAARADHVRELLLGRAAAHDETVGALGALLAGEPDEA